jgi:hypothetical protein
MFPSAVMLALFLVILEGHIRAKPDWDSLRSNGTISKARAKQIE